ncbi:MULTISPECIES: rolling circle replication-associated protein [Fusobacterium]|mgnify:FL=1|uniref:Rep protein n=2 Tax=Fusobacterium TaxID=848 RepID=A0A2C6C309_FUSNP|nr:MULTISPECIES: Rep protein [Fusobacterium]PHI10803.1 Rep protein [Fusobacterium polymorphum]
MKFYNTKEIKSKNITEYIFNIDALTAFDFKRRPGRKRRDFEELSSIEKAESMQRRKAYYQDKRFEIKRIIDCNYDDKSTFLTLTFKENIQDIERANREFTLFIKRLKRYLKNQQLKYIATWELQQRGAIHYHLVLFSVPYIDNKKLGELWANGFIKINKIKETVKNEAVGVYITKYFVKDLEKKANQKKAYFCSRNLIKPKETKKKLDFDEMNDILTDEKDLLYIKNFIARELLEIDVSTGEKIYREVKKVYVVKKNKEMDLQNKKNMLNSEVRQKELSPNNSI